MYEIFEKLCIQHNVTPYRVCKETGITTATISNWKAGRYVPKADKLQKIADYFGVSLSYLMSGKKSQRRKSRLLLRRIREILKKILDTRSRVQLLNQEGLMFDGDPASPEAIDSILSAMQIGMELAKRKIRKNIRPKSIKRTDAYGH